MAFQIPSYLQAKTYSAKDDRRVLTSLGSQAGASRPGDVAVTVATGMQVSVAAGFVLVRGTTNPEQGLYVAYNDAPVLKTLSNGGTNPRIDQIIVRVYDSQELGSGADISDAEVLQGSEVAGATLDNRNGAAALPANAIRLADILVPAGAVSLAAGNVRDRRTFARGYFRSRLDTDTTERNLQNNFYAAATVQRVECNGNPLLITAQAGAIQTNQGGAPTFVASFAVVVDAAFGVGATGWIISRPMTKYVADNRDPARIDRPVIHGIYTPTAGSHIFRSGVEGSNATDPQRGYGPYALTIQEIVGGVTSNGDS